MHPQGHLLLVLRDLFPGWMFSISGGGVWIARAEEGRVAATGMNVEELLDALYVADPSARDRVADLLAAGRRRADASVEAHLLDVGGRFGRSPGARRGRGSSQAFFAGTAVGLVLGALGVLLVLRRRRRAGAGR